MSLELQKNFCYFLWDMYNIPELRALSHSSTNPSTIQYSSAVLAILACVIGLVGNIIVIYVTGFLMKNNKSKIWFLNLAVADFAFLLVLPLHAVSVLRASWPFGTHVCKLYNFLFLVNMYASIYIITALNVDRALSVAKPIWHRRFISRRFCYTICTLIWAIAMLSGTPTFVYSDEFEVNEETHCYLFLKDLTRFSYVNVNHNSTEGYIYQTFPQEICQNQDEDEDVDLTILWNELISSTMGFVIPLVVIGYLIPLCIILLSNTIIAIKVKPSQSSSRLYRLVVTAVMVFFCTRAPIVLAQIIFLVAADALKLTLMYKVIAFLPLLSSIAAINSCLNPIVYVLMGKQVKTLIKDSFNRCNPFTQSNLCI